jgi:hypothetical protein
MANTFSENSFSTTYKDDFIDSDNYHRVLFNSGRALQARELTQMQTIIQEEIGRFGRNIFKEGASVNPGGPTINNNYEFVKLNTSSNTLPTDTTTLVGTEFTGQTSGVKARVLQVVTAEGSDPATLYVQYTDTSAATPGANPIRMSAGEDINNGSDTLTVQSAAPAVGRGSKVANGAGDFFVRGHFVFVKPQELILSKYTRNPTKTVGFKITEDIVTVADDTALYDNQGATPNLSSPGADRYRITLTLTTQDQVANDENFVYYCDIVDGQILDQVSGTEDYNKINEVLAERTREESGNYIVSPFTVDFTDSGTNLIASVSDGIAYINGYRGASEVPKKLTIAKPRTTETTNNEVTGISYGQYFITDSASTLGRLNTNTQEVVNLRSGATHGGSTIGTAKVRYVEEDGSQYRVYLYDIKMNGGSAVRQIRSVGTDSIDCINPLLENGQAVIKEGDKVNLVYPLTNPRPSDITDVDFEVQRQFAGGTNGSGSITISVNAAGERLVNKNQWIVTRDDTGAVVTGATITIPANLLSAQITNLPASQPVTIYAKVNKAQASSRQKTLTETTFSSSVESDGGGVKFINLHAADIYDVISIKQTDSDGADLSYLFTVDKGQRPGYYDNGRLVLETGATAPSGSIFTRFKHFTHGGGDFFDVTSYTGQVNYKDIPAFSTGPRTSVNLRDVIDFRSVVDSDGTFTGTGAVVNELPTNGDIFQGNVTYYQPRRDKIVISTDGVLKNITGEAGFDAQFPQTPENTLGLFLLEHNAYGLHDSDVSMTPLEAKRFTMADINNLEKRVDRLEEVTSLSLLEVDTSSLLVLDSSGSPRSKSGFFVDNFADRSFTDTENEENRSAIDPSRGLLSSQTEDNNINLVYDHSKSSNTILKGDNVYLNYTESVAISQTTISGAENVNPFAVITGEGSLTLSPASDEWFQTKYKPANVINKTATEDLGVLNEGRLGRGTASNRRRAAGSAWTWQPASWVPIAGFGFLGGLNLFGGWLSVPTWNVNGVRTVESRRLGGRWQQTTFEQRVVVSERTTRKVTGDRTVSLTFLPFMRSRKIMFRAEGMRPNTRYFPFFDGRDVSAYCREETFTRFASGTSLSYGNRYRNSSAHPQGSTNLESNADGKIEGSFFLPSKEGGLQFRGGTREFKLLDINIDNDAGALSRASTNYTSQGTLDTRQQTITNTRITTVRRRRWTEVTRRDPLAQSFYVNKPSGMFVTKVDVFFKSKDSTVPIEMQIRPVVNGQPSATDIITNAIKFLSPSEVNTAASQTQAAAVAAPTTFEFDEPIFLNPNTEYCIVLLAESKEYEAYVAETYAFELGSTEKRVNRQPSMGSLFKSQNGSTWTPDQTKDLAFKIYQADFNTAGGYAVFENADVPDEILANNPFFTDSGDATVTMLFPNHGYSVGDTINITGLDSATRYNGILGSSIMNPTAPNGLVTAVDGFGLRFEADSASTSAGRFGGNEIVVDQQLNFDVAIPNFSTILPDDTTLSYGVKFTTGSSLAGSETRYQKDPNYSGDIQIGDENLFPRPRLIAKTANEAAADKLNGERSVTFKVDLGTSRSDVSPMIDAQRTSLTTISNLIDNQDVTVPLNYQAETNAFGGSALSKHHTSVQNLEEDAVGLKVILAAVRPSGSHIDLYYRVANDGENIFDVDWTLQSSETTIAPDRENFREYRYLIGGDGGDLNSFTQYQLKLVFRTTNQSTPPIVKDLRGIALAV